MAPIKVRVERTVRPYNIRHTVLAAVVSGSSRRKLVQRVDVDNIKFRDVRPQRRTQGGRVFVVVTAAYGKVRNRDASDLGWRAQGNVEAANSVSVCGVNLRMCTTAQKFSAHLDRGLRRGGRAGPPRRG